MLDHKILKQLKEAARQVGTYVTENKNIDMTALVTESHQEKIVKYFWGNHLCCDGSKTCD